MAYQRRGNGRLPQDALETLQATTKIRRNNRGVHPDPDSGARPSGAPLAGANVEVVVWRI
jgi:hypothetical protein